MSDTIHLEIALLQSSQSQKEVTVNEALSRLDAVLNTGAIDRALDTPPGSPSEGDVYIIGSSPTDDWADHAGEISYYYADAWNFITPNEGMCLWVNDEDLIYAYDGSDWVVGAGGGSLETLDDVNITGLATYEMLQYDGSEFVNTSNLDNLSRVGVNTTADTNNKLSVNSDAVLFNTDTGDCQIKVNKSTSTDTASYLFQTGFSGRAEFGLVGDDDFQLKVSSDGSSFTQSFVIDHTDGSVDFKQEVVISDQISCGDNPVVRAEIKDYAETLATNATSGSTATIDLESGNVHEVTLTANCTFTFSNPPASGKAGSFTLILKQDGTGSRTVTWPAAVDWSKGTAPTLSTDASAVDILTFLTTDGGSRWYGFFAGEDMQ